MLCGFIGLSLTPIRRWEPELKKLKLFEAWGGVGQVEAACQLARVQWARKGLALATGSSLGSMEACCTLSTAPPKCCCGPRLSSTLLGALSPFYCVGVSCSLHFCGALEMSRDVSLCAGIVPYGLSFGSWFALGEDGAPSGGTYTKAKLPCRAWFKNTQKAQTSMVTVVKLVTLDCIFESC